MKRLYLHEEGYHKRKRRFKEKRLLILTFVAHDDLGSEIVFEELEKFIKETGRQL